MKKIAYLFIFVSVFLAGCPKHEIIPAPKPKAKLDGHLTGKINGTDVEFTKDVAGYFVNPDKTKIVLSSPQLSRAKYYSEMKSSESLVSVKIGLGNVQWDASVSGDPTVAQFNAFFTNPVNMTPVYAAAADGGFEVEYRDGEGNVWTSNPADAGNTVAFTNIVQESDGNGDYSKFVCSFNCVVHRTQINPSPQPPTILDLNLENIVFTGWFER